MPFPLAVAAVSIFVRMLQNLKGILAKGEAFAREKGIDPSQLLHAQLAPDMFDLVKQVQIASDNAKGVARLAGMEPPVMEDSETTFAELTARIDKTITFLGTLTPTSFDGGEIRQIPFPYAEGKYLTGADQLTLMTLPNFFFHVTTAYDILRHQGVQIGKMDYIGDLPLKDLLPQ